MNRITRSACTVFCCLLIIACTWQVTVSLEKKPGTGNTELLEHINKAYIKGLDYLVTRQHADGSFGTVQKDVGITGLIVSAIAQLRPESQTPYKKTLVKAVAYILKQQNKDGSFGEGKGLANYWTSISIMALGDVNAKKYSNQIAKGRTYLNNTQFSENYKGFKKDEWQYGGFDYDSNEKAGVEKNAGPDLNNTGFALESLKKAGLPKDSDVWKRAVYFLKRCQNSSEVSDLPEIFKKKKGKKIALTDDGGAMYYPGNSKVEEDTKEGRIFHSYGSMSYILLQSYLFCGIDKDDRKVKEVMAWIRKNFSLDVNPGLEKQKKENAGKQGLFSYYRVMSSALLTYGEPSFKIGSGRTVHWAEALSLKLLQVQDKSGKWVNKASRWWEGDPVLVTAYSLLTLDNCVKQLKKGD